LNVDFNKDRLWVRQLALSTPLRVQEAAKESWDVVAELLEVRKRVTRHGVRIIVTWSADSDEEVEAAMVGTGLVKETAEWAQTMGTPAKRSFIGIEARGDSEKLRYQLHSGNVRMEGTVPHELESFRAPYALVLDVEWSTEWTTPGASVSLRGEDVKSRVREAWKFVMEKAKLTSEAIERWTSSH
jgi:hypothetical protein